MSIIFTCKLSAQDSLQVNYNFMATEKGFSSRPLKLPNIIRGDTAATRSILRINQQLHDLGYLAATWIKTDTLKEARKIKGFTFHFSVGARYRWAYLRSGNVPSIMLEAAGFKSSNYPQRPFNHKDLIKVQNRLLSYAENHGYPFAKIGIDSLVIDDTNHLVAGQFTWEQGKLFTFGKIILADIPKKARITNRYLVNYLGIKNGQPYDESTIKNLRNRLRELPFVEELKAANINFAEGKADVLLFLKNKRASQFDFLVGFLPTTDNITGRSKLNLTGNANIDLYNPFGSGERLTLKWQQVSAGTQQLDIKVNYPYIFNFPFGVDAAFSLYKKDTSYLDLSYNLGIQYLLTGNDYIKVFGGNFSTNLLGINTAPIISSRRLPNVIDLSNTTFGLEYRRQRLDYRFNPRQGYSLTLRGTAGIKNIKRNNRIEDLVAPQDSTFDFASLYDTVALRSFQYRVEASAEYFLPFGKRSTVRFAVNGGLFVSKADLFSNELYRLGGNRSIRGFDEESLPASQYAIGTIEYRLLFGTNSYFFVFTDGAILQNYSRNTHERDYPFGVGAGMALETKVGVFALSYALGRRSDVGLQVRNAKIHFGYVNYF